MNHYEIQLRLFTGPREAEITMCGMLSFQQLGQSVYSQQASCILKLHNCTWLGVPAAPESLTQRQYFRLTLVTLRGSWTEHCNTCCAGEKRRPATRLWLPANAAQFHAIVLLNELQVAVVQQHGLDNLVTDT